MRGEGFATPRGQRPRGVFAQLGWYPRRWDLIRRCRATFPVRGEGFEEPRGQRPRGVLRLDGNQRDGPLA